MVLYKIRYTSTDLSFLEKFKGNKSINNLRLSFA